MGDLPQQKKKFIVSDEKGTIHPLRVAWEGWILPKLKLTGGAIVFLLIGWYGHAIWCWFN